MSTLQSPKSKWKITFDIVNINKIHCHSFSTKPNKQFEKLYATLFLPNTKNPPHYFPDTDRSSQTIITIIVRQLTAISIINVHFEFYDPTRKKTAETNEKLHSIFPRIFIHFPPHSIFPTELISTPLLSQIWHIHNKWRHTTYRETFFSFHQK